MRRRTDHLPDNWDQLSPAQQLELAGAQQERNELALANAPRSVRLDVDDDWEPEDPLEKPFVAASTIAEHQRRLNADSDYRARMEAERAADLVRARSQAIDRLLARGVPAKDATRVVDGDLLDTMAMAQARLLMARPPGVAVIAGPPGLGKTVALSWLVAQRCPEPCRTPTAGMDQYERQQAMDRLRKGSPSGWPAQLRPRFITAAALTRVSAFKGDELATLETCSLLAIDELGAEFVDSKGYWDSLLDSLINARYAAMLRTVISTNLSREDFRQRYGERIADRVRETGSFCLVTGKSLRRAPRS